MIIGLDISTSCVGIAIVDPETKKLISTEAIDLQKIESVFEKSEMVGATLWQISQQNNITDVFIETALKRFVPGRSRADTIIKLAKFNGIISFIAYDTFGIEPTYLNVNTARSYYGLSFPRGTKGPARKKMVIEAVIEKEKTTFKWEMARGGKNYKRTTDDRADAVVIARAGEYILRNAGNEGFLTEKIVLLE
jgi:hypothetical protein